MRYAIATILAVALCGQPPVHAADTDVAPGPSQLIVEMGIATQSQDAVSHNSGTASDEVVTWHEAPVCDSGGAALCNDMLLCADGSPLTQVWSTGANGEVLSSSQSCPSDEIAVQPIEITPSMALRALRRVPLPESVLTVQPPNGRTLVNFDTNFFTEAAPFDRTVRILGQRVDLRIWPSAFTWHFGDGTTRTTSEPGAPYPRLDVTHAYLRKGRVSPSVDTTYSADFRVNGGPWRPVTGTVTMAGAPETLEVVTARPTLVGHSR